MKFLVCIAALVAVASAAPGYAGLAHGIGYAAPAIHAAPFAVAAPVVAKVAAPVATSYANYNSVHVGQVAVAAPAVHAVHAAPVVHAAPALAVAAPAVHAVAAAPAYGIGYGVGAYKYGIHG